MAIVKGSKEMPPKAQGKTMQDPTPPIGEHDPKVEKESGDLKDQPVLHSGAVPVGVPSADVAPPDDEVMVDTGQYGRMSVADLKEVLRAELEAEAKAKQDKEDAKLPELCETCFPQGWDSKNAVNQDGVGCEHGNWSRTRAKE